MECIKCKYCKVRKAEKQNEYSKYTCELKKFVVYRMETSVKAIDLFPFKSCELFSQT